MRPPAPSPLSIAAVALCLAGSGGCAPDATFPTLRPRAVESAASPVPVAAVSPKADAALDASVATLARTATEAATSFDEEARTAEPIVSQGAGAAPGSEAWVQAQQALARLEAAREPLTRALAGLDALRIEAQANGAIGDTTRLDAEWTRTQALQQHQIERYEALAAKVRPAG